MVEVFKTDVRHTDQSMMLVRKLKTRLPGCCINFDLEDCDNVLRVEGEKFSTEGVIRVLNSCGFHCEVLAY
ncbi:MAG: hypothetical protein JWR38_4192 [Mucilaginibacter sp.]|nr:hypothetical protein [Mucilaginibacter sp.]